MTPSQKAAAAVMAEPYYAKEAKKRQKDGQKLGGKIAGRGRRKDNSIVAKFPRSKSRDESAESFGVSGRYVSQAKKLLEEQPELFKEVHEGKKSFTTPLRASKRYARRISITSYFVLNVNFC